MHDSNKSISSLPNELLLEITHYLPATGDIHALLCANRRLALLLQHVLSAELVFTDHLVHNDSSRRRHNLFSITMVHTKSLVARLISLNIDLDATVCNCNIHVSQWCRCGPPLHHAIKECNTTMVTSLLRRGASIMARSATTGENAVHQSIRTTVLNCGYFRVPREEDLAIMRILLAEGRINRMNDAVALSADHKTWLNMAVELSPRKTVWLVIPFLVRGLDPNVANINMKTPLHTAVRNNRPDLAELLLLRGANHRTMDSLGATPWTMACNRPNCALIHLLLRRDYKLSGTVVNDKGETVEMILQRELDRLLSMEDDDSDGWKFQVRERTNMLRRLKELASASM